MDLPSVPHLPTRPATPSTHTTLTQATPSLLPLCSPLFPCLPPSRTQTAGLENKMQGGFQLLSRTAMPGTPGDVCDVNGKPVMKFGPNNTRGSTVSVI